MLDVPAPLIAALNGPATVHTEYALLADVVLATPDSIFQDKPHLNFGILPGDGVHSLWQEVVGPIRGRTSVLTQQIIGAGEAKTLGAVTEIVPRDKLMARIVDESVGYGRAREHLRRRRRSNERPTD
jgi:enoyl-CoA hydratase/carnithine racemase